LTSSGQYYLGLDGCVPDSTMLRLHHYSTTLVVQYEEKLYRTSQPHASALRKDT
jgi:hypothetical protein